MLSKINKEKIDDIRRINSSQNELIKFILKDQKVKKEVKTALKDMIYNTDNIMDLYLLEQKRFLLYNTIPTYKNKKDLKLTEYENLYIKLLNIIKKYLNNKDYKFMFKERNYSCNIFNIIEELSGLINTFRYEDLKYILETINESNSCKVNLTKTYLRLCTGTNINNIETNKILIEYIKRIEDENKQITVEKIIKTFFNENSQKISKCFAFELLDEIMECKDDNKLLIINRFLDIIHNNGYFMEGNNFDQDILSNILEKIEKNYKKENFSIYLDLLNESTFVNSKLNNKEKMKILNIILNKEIDEKTKIKLFNYIKKVIIKCEDDKLRGYFIENINNIKYGKSYDWLIEFYPIIIKHGSLPYQRGYISALTELRDNVNENEIVQKTLSIQLNYTKDDLK